MANDHPICKDVRVKLSGTDGNAFSIISNVKKAMVRAEVDKATIDAFFKEATSGNYDHMLRTCMKYVEVS